MGARTSVDFIDNHQFRALVDEGRTARVLLDVVDGKNLKRIVLIDGGIALDFAVEPGLCAGADDYCLHADFVLDFLLPLVAKVR